jgi:hypothetical protein
MREKDFWKLIGKSKSMLARSPEKQQQRLIRILTRRTLQEIIIFDSYFQHFMEIAHTWPLRSAASLVRGKDSEEFFQDFRGWLICRGEKAWYRVLRNPDKVAGYISLHDPLDWVGYDTCAAEAYELKSGHEMPPQGEIRGSRWPEAELADRYPALWKKFVR